MMSNKQTNKKNPIISASIAQSQRGFFFWGGGDGMESYRPKQLDEHRGGYRRRKKVNKVHEGEVKVQKFKKTEDGCAADGAYTPHSTVR